jgi:hypothetical protein
MGLSLGWWNGLAFSVAQKKELREGSRKVAIDFAGCTPAKIF